MSLDLYIEAVRPTTVWDRNITHNLNRLAKECGLYQMLWHPEEIAGLKCGDAIPALEAGLAKMKAMTPEECAPFLPSNGWGTREGLVEFVESFLAACREYPDGVLRAST